MLRGALSQLFGGSAEAAIAGAGIDPTARGETLLLSDFMAIANTLSA